MEFLTASNLAQLGLSGLPGAALVFMVWQNHCQRKDLTSERDYSKSQDERLHAFALKSVEAMGRMEQAFHALKDVLR